MYESRCGVPCNSCERKEQVSCRGCLNMERPFWGGECSVKSCCEEKKLPHCGKCPQFPCDMLSNMGADQGFDPAPKIANCRKWAEEGEPLTVRFYECAEDEKILFAVIAAKSEGKWVFCKHRQRDTYELPGGRREPGETAIQTAQRELREETGAESFHLQPVAAYSVTGKTKYNSDGGESFGMLYYGEIQSFDPQLHYEIGEIILRDEMPPEMTYPQIQPKLLEYVQAQGFGI